MADWFSSNAPSAAPTQAPEKDWFASNAPQQIQEPEPEKPSGAGAMATGGALATLAAGVPVVRSLAERIATSPIVSRGMAMANRAGAPLNVGMEAYNVLSGQKSPTQALGGALKGELMRRGANLAYRSAAPVASALGTPVAAAASGGLAGLAGTAGFLGALQHDANRDVQIDYSKNTPDTWVARAFGGRPDDVRMDDPNDPQFRPDDTAVVRASVLAQLGARP